MKRGLVLFGHGARDQRWAEPLESVLRRCNARRPDVPVVLGFLEFLRPDLEGALQLLIDQACDDIVIVPMFLGQGGHVRHQVPALVAALQQMHPGRRLSLAPSVGEDASVLEALSDYCLAQLADGGPDP